MSGVGKRGRRVQTSGQSLCWGNVTVLNFNNIIIIYLFFLNVHTGKRWLFTLTGPKSKHSCARPVRERASAHQPFFALFRRGTQSQQRPLVAGGRTTQTKSLLPESQHHFSRTIDSWCFIFVCSHLKLNTKWAIQHSNMHSCIRGNLCTDNCVRSITSW